MMTKRMSLRTDTVVQRTRKEKMKVHIGSAIL